MVSDDLNYNPLIIEDESLLILRRESLSKVTIVDNGILFNGVHIALCNNETIRLLRNSLREELKT